MRHLHLSAIAVAATGATAMALGCIHRQAGGFPLYEPSTPRRPEQQVARLYGPIESVDGRDVTSFGGSFDLPPGCHVVVIRKQMLDRQQPDAVSRQFSSVTFAFHMRPSHAYIIEAPERNGGEAGAAVVAAHEEAPDGTKTHVGPAESDRIIAGCKASGPG